MHEMICQVRSHATNRRASRLQCTQFRIRETITSTCTFTWQVMASADIVDKIQIEIPEFMNFSYSWHEIESGPHMRPPPEEENWATYGRMLTHLESMSSDELENLVQSSLPAPTPEDEVT